MRGMHGLIPKETRPGAADKFRNNFGGLIAKVRSMRIEIARCCLRLNSAKQHLNRKSSHELPPILLLNLKYKIPYFCLSRKGKKKALELCSGAIRSEKNSSRNF